MFTIESEFVQLRPSKQEHKDGYRYVKHGRSAEYRSSRRLPAPNYDRHGYDSTTDSKVLYFIVFVDILSWYFALVKTKPIVF